jgi:glycosyltransferase involved in cell wall biosynthesis
VAVSVIVPVYNSRDYLSRCLNSLLNQTLQHIEILAVDDGSTDDSGDILRRYAREDRRVKIIQHDENRGLHIARISGVLAAAGNYIGYVDSDDYVASDMFESMHTHATTQGADVVRAGARLLREELPVDDGGSLLTFAERTYSSGIDYLNADFYPSMWLHLHHRRLWDLALPHMPVVRLVGEDNLTSFMLAFFAGPVVSMANAVYFYVERDNSLSGDQSFTNVVRHIEDRGRIVKLLRTFLDDHGSRADRGWTTVRDSNRGLLFSYIDSLKTPSERLNAIALFESTWDEEIPASRIAQWQA